MSAAGLVRLLSLGALAAALTACNSSNSTPTTATSGTGTGATSATVVVTINGMNGDNSYVPNPAKLLPGQSIAWKNSDTVAHTATQDDGVFDTGVIAPGATSAPVTMPNVGSYAYHCSIHPTMVGKIDVLP
jgi:plastocyanin